METPNSAILWSLAINRSRDRYLAENIICSIPPRSPAIELYFSSSMMWYGVFGINKQEYSRRKWQYSLMMHWYFNISNLSISYFLFYTIALRFASVEKWDRGICKQPLLERQRNSFLNRQTKNSPRVVRVIKQREQADRSVSWNGKHYIRSDS